MKANTNRTYATAFDAQASSYDAGRRVVPADLLAGAFTAAGLGSGSRVLEVGAGTGQFTTTLLRRGLDVVAVEPGEQMRAILAGRYPELSLRSGYFEDQPPEPGAYDGIVGANSWHWVEPDRGYPLAATLLRPRGSLLFYWTFALLEAELQRRLNAEVFTGPYGNQARDPETFDEHIADVTAAGRAEIADSGLFDLTSWELIEDTVPLTLEAYLDYLRSFADIASLDAPAQHLLAERVSAVVGTQRVTMIEQIYVVAARRR